MRRANKFYADSRDRLEPLQRVVDKNGGSEKVFQAATAGTREGATVLRQVMGSLPKEAQRDVTAAVIKRMGLANPNGQDKSGEVFSAASFLTNWNKLSSEAQHAPFNRFGPEMSQNITKIAQVAERIKQSDAILRSTSGTGPNAAAASYWGSLGLSAIRGYPSIRQACGGRVRRKHSRSRNDQPQRRSLVGTRDRSSCWSAACPAQCVEADCR